MVVLDTNVVLDWLLFEDATVRPIASAVMQQRLRWIVSSAMRDEFAQVLGAGLAAAHGREAANLLQAWDRYVTPRPSAASHPLRCRDADDQMFIDLALSAGARWLVSRDGAVLALRRRAALLGLRIVRPAEWMPQ